MGKILIVEDDLKLARLMGRFLEQHGFEVAECHRGDEATEACRRFAPDLIVLDLMLPGRDGLQVCRDVRSFSMTPILMQTAREEDVDQILGLESGADDYVIKPVEPPVLLARIRALLRRPSMAVADCLRFGPLTIDRGKRMVMLDGCEVELSTVEFETLWALASHAGQVLSRDDIMNLVRGIDFNGLDRSVDVCVSKLRRKLNDDPRDPRRIKTVWGRGYLFSTPDWGV
ncbi:MAG: response regulator [Microvirgula sp.]